MILDFQSRQYILKKIEAKILKKYQSLTLYEPMLKVQREIFQTSFNFLWDSLITFEQTQTTFPLSY